VKEEMKIEHGKIYNGVKSASLRQELFEEAKEKFSKKREKK